MFVDKELALKKDDGMSDERLDVERHFGRHVSSSEDSCDKASVVHKLVSAMWWQIFAE